MRFEFHFDVHLNHSFVHVLLEIEIKVSKMFLNGRTVSGSLVAIRSGKQNFHTVKF